MNTVSFTPFMITSPVLGGKCPLVGTYSLINTWSELVKFKSSKPSFLSFFYTMAPWKCFAVKRTYNTCDYYDAKSMSRWLPGCKPRRIVLLHNHVTSEMQLLPAKGKLSAAPNMHDHTWFHLLVLACSAATMPPRHMGKPWMRRYEGANVHTWPLLYFCG